MLYIYSYNIYTHKKNYAITEYLQGALDVEVMLVQNRNTQPISPSGSQQHSLRAHRVLSQ